MLEFYKNHKVKIKNLRENFRKLQKSSLKKYILVFFMKKVIKKRPQYPNHVFQKKRKSEFRGKGSTQYVKMLKKSLLKPFVLRQIHKMYFFVICKKTTEVKHLLTLPLSNFNDLEGKCNFAGKGERFKFLFSSESSVHLVNC